MRRKRSTPTGIRVRHARPCPAARDTSASCKCRPSYEAAVYSARDKRQIRKSFPTRAAALAWRADATTAVRKGTMRAPTSTTLREAADAFVAGARDGTIRNRSGDVYKPSVVRGYEQALRDRILPDLGGRRLGDVSRFDLQDLVDRLLADGLDASTIRNALMPLRAIFRRALVRGVVSVNPTQLLELPAVRGTRERTAMPDEMAHLLAALPAADRALWATAYFAGLRLGELRALRFADLDLDDGIPVIRVERSWDQKAGVVAPKSRSGARRVPVVDVLRRLLREHRLLLGHRDGYVFARRDGQPFAPVSVYKRADTAWTIAGIGRITLHECRHSFVSRWLEAGVPKERVKDYTGHAQHDVTERYRHVGEGTLSADLALVNSYFARESDRLFRQAT
jgi:integrase